MSGPTRWYRILDVHAGVTSDSPAALQAIEEDFALFAAPGPAIANQFRLEIRLQGERPDLAVDGVRTSLAGHPNPLHFVRQAFVRTLSSRIRRFLLLHGAVVKRGPTLLVLAGPPGFGKTTLTEMLLDRGWGFFSDDYCPLEHRTGFVYPFPRALRRVSPPGPETGGPALVPEKVAVLPRRDQARIGGKPAPPSAFVWLAPGAPASRKPEATTPAPETQAVALTLKTDCPPWLNELGPLAAGRRLEVQHLGNAQARIVYAVDRETTQLLSQWLEDHRDGLWHYYREAPPPPRFDGTPSLEPLAVADAVRFLLRDVKRSPFLPETPDEPGGGGNSPARLFFELSRRFAGARCFQLRVGHREAAADLLDSLSPGV